MEMSVSRFQDLVMDREAWSAVVHGVRKSWTWLSDWTELIPIWGYGSGLHWNQSELRIQIPFSFHLHLFGMGRGLSYPNWKGKISNQGPPQHCPQIWNASDHSVGQWPALVAETVQLVARALKIQWKLCIAYCPQSSGKVECMNWTLKQGLANYVRRLAYLG